MIDPARIGDQRPSSARGKAFLFSGPGFHTGRRNQLRFSRAPAGTEQLWIGTRVIDVRSRRWHPESSRRCTTLGDVGPLEHLLAAICVLGVDGWILEAEHADLPLFDGSALAWKEAIVATGQTAKPCVLRGDWRPMTCSDARGRIRFEPSDHLEWNVGWSRGLEGPETWYGGQEDLEAILAARTFVHSHEFVQARAAGLLMGVSAESGRLLRGTLGTEAEHQCAQQLGVDPSMTSWTGGASRMMDECASHKALDLVGDLRLVLGGIPCGKIEVRDAGHSLHLALCRALLAGTTGQDVL